VLRRGQIARFTDSGLDRVVDVPVPNPSDIAFAGPGLDRLFVTSIAFDLGDGMQPTNESGWLLAVDGLGATGCPEPRFGLR
jgi:sugar lactone lactonase YvrE